MEQSKQNVLFTKQQLKALILPLLLEQILNVTMGFADTFMVAGVGEAAVSSVSLVDSLNVLFTQLLSALASGGAVVASQYLGHGDREKARQSAAQLVSVLLFSTCLLVVLGLSFARPILRLIFGQIDDDVMNFSQIYFCVSVISYPFIGLYNAGAALFRAQGNSKISMRASLVMNIVNVLGNALMIYGFRLGVLGAAIATLIGRVVAAAWVLVQHQSQNNPFRIAERSDLIPDFRLIGKILGIGIPTGVENAMFQIGKLCVSSLVSTLGTAAIAANAVGNTLSTIANIPGSTMSLAMIPVVSRCLGAGEKEQAKQYSKGLLKIALLGLLGTNVVMFCGIPIFAQWFNLSEEAIALCILIMRSFNVVSIFFWGASFTLPNILRAGGDVRYTMTVSALSMWFCRVIASYYFVNELQLGLLGVWMGMFLDWVVRSLLFGIRYISGKWMEIKVI